jgi:hypothetical protein
MLPVTFLDLPALALAAIAVPVLLALYFLRLRRRRLRIPSTILWRRSTEDIQANVPFQRLRFSPLLVLQLLAIAAIILALGRPVLRAEAGQSQRLILLVDRSASMSALDSNGRTRLEDAKQAARTFVQRIGRASEPAELMVVAFASSAQALCGFESDRRRLIEAIESIAPSDEEADLDAALDLAGAFAGGQESSQPAPEVALFSDGGVRPPVAPGGFSLRAGRFRFVRAGNVADDVDNTGIASFSARRDHREPDQVLVLARLVNAAARPVTTAVTLRVDGVAAEIRSVTIAGAAEHPGEAAFSAVLDLPGGAILSLALGHRDQLPADDTAALVIQPQTAPRIGLIHAGERPDPYLVALLESVAPQRLMITPASGPSSLDPASLDPAWPKADVDMLVYDRLSPARDPEVPALLAGALPHGASRRVEPGDSAMRVLSWDRAHPLLRHVALDTLVYSGAGGVELPPGWTALAQGPEGPVIAARTAPTRQVAVLFALSKSNWPTDLSIAVFIKNALDYLFPAGAEPARAFRPGEPVVVRSRPGSHRLTVAGLELDVEPETDVTLPALQRVGLYAVPGAEPPMDRIAVNLASDVESDTRFRPALVVNAAAARAQAAAESAPVELWPFLAFAAAVLLLLEWIVYCLRVRG